MRGSAPGGEISGLILLIGLFGVVNLFGYEFELVVGSLFQCAVEARLVADVALTCTYPDLQNQAILVAVHQYHFNLLEMSALLSLFPEFPAASAEKYRPARPDSLGEGLGVHIGLH